jgi:ankyrin repeat protein
MWAAAEGHSDVVQFLIEKGANVNAASQSGFTPLVFATVKDDAESIRHLVAAGADPNTTLPSGARAVNVAAAYGNTAAALALIESGADVNAADRSGNTPLHAAAQQGDLPLVKALLAKGADPNARTAKADNSGRRSFFRRAGELTPLLTSANAGHLDVMRALVAGGADPKLKGDDGTTLLMQAVGSAKLPIVKYAYQLDNDVMAVTDSGNTVMHATVTGTSGRSTQEEICDVIRFLAEKGADPDSVNDRGRTPIQIADIIPIDKAALLFYDLIIKAGRTPKVLPKDIR